MVTSVLHDPLKRGLNILPSECKFGPLRAGGAYEMMVTIKNEDHIPQRIIVKPPVGNPFVKVQQLDYGPIAPGMLKKVKVVIVSKEGEHALVKEILQICAKNDIYKIAISAEVLATEEFEEKERETQTIQGRSLGNSRVREKIELARKGVMDRFRVEEIRRKNPGADLDDDAQSQEGRPRWGETTNSDHKLPKIPSIGDREFNVDASKPLNEVLGRGQAKH
jgi:hypothetical protein